MGKISVEFANKLEDTKWAIEILWVQRLGTSFGGLFEKEPTPEEFLADLFTERSASSRLASRTFGRFNRRYEEIGTFGPRDTRSQLCHQPAPGAHLRTRAGRRVRNIKELLRMPRLVVEPH